MAKQWYVVHTFSGHENKVKKYLDNLVVSSGLEDRIGRVVVPTEKVARMKDGKRMVAERRFLPSYVLVEMEMDKQTWYVVRNTPGVTGFVGAGKRPQPLRKQEIQRILQRLDEGKAEHPQLIALKPGDSVKVIDGPFKDLYGVVEEVNPERRKIKVMVSIFSRSTPVELDVLQVEKIKARK
ncbi:MAG: transcription termination/antitermination protein NusG [Candidatus Latescibacteria bacterium 4484_181]|nr:transcription termination/antitermination factor NusG [Candidatus Latescibacterota bacterium]OPX32653.1 MAG: transcription termination/antitermination protein NusG [Candidatus Latescibacteria bacterium 4484_181]RKY69278.1 MAG: transcription termination/antitermination protein NusG [Candidatus Latescibacterota bacterium]RKY73203.1 MAG: transcription termination/antitermination protein NusG [Candidatus Latescibacterota bacterium]